MKLMVFKIIIVIVSVFCFSFGDKDCLDSYKAELTFVVHKDSIDIDSIYDHLVADSLFSLTIKNAGTKELRLANVPSITYKFDRAPFPDIFVEIWFMDSSGNFIFFENHSADIDFVIDITSEDNTQKLKPKELITLSDRMNPFYIHGTNGIGTYKIRACYRTETPLGDYIAYSNFVYVKCFKGKGK